jgi:hypothetical protein
MPWILGATVWKRLHGIYTTGPAVGLITEYHVDANAHHACYYLFLDGWSMSQPYVIQEPYFFVNKH